VIDGGPTDVVLSKLGEAMPFYDREIDVMILSHPHADHITGLISILKNYTVKYVYLTGAVHTSYEYQEFLRQLVEHPEIQKIKVDHQFAVNLGTDTKIEFLYPDFDVANEAARKAQPFIEDNLNNTSIVAKLIYKDYSFLFTGDIEKEAEEYLLSSSNGKTEKAVPFSVRADVLKVPHQGSRTSSTLPFLEAVRPQKAIITVGSGNQYGHPHQETLSKFISLGIPVYRTDEEGDIRMVY
jgi:competence protein ComEC